jgi:glycosyltransferase involved in cell wall biosynthesis
MSMTLQPSQTPLSTGCQRGKPQVSIIVPSFNEGDLIRRTAENLATTVPDGGEVIIVDDLSTDLSCQTLDSLRHVRVLRPVRRLGASGARNFGAQNARGSTLVFCDAHILAPYGWFPSIHQLLQRSHVGMVGPVYREMNSPGIKGYGLILSDAGLNWDWMEQQSDMPYSVPMLGGFFLAMRSQVFWGLGGFDEGFGIWGMEDFELALRAWLFGLECKLHPGIEVDHLSRDSQCLPEYQTDWSRGLQNVLRVAVLHLSQERLQKVFEFYKHDPAFVPSLAALTFSDVWERRAHILGNRLRSDHYFFERFRIQF